MRQVMLGLCAIAAMGCAEGDSGVPDASRMTLMDAGDPTCEGRTLCGAVCVDTSTDVDHCGGCDQGCEVGQSCESGECVTDCGGGLTACAASCVDTATDSAHCGSCGNACGAAERCEAGSCVPDCAADETDCTGSCVDTSSDPGHCGSCSNACGAGELCSAGECKADCDPGLTDCGGACVDLGSDRRHCGSCGEACATNEECSGGSCACPTETCAGTCCETGTTCLGSSCCSPTWSTTIAGVLPADVAVDADGTIYVTGTYQDDEAYVGSLDPCGTLTDDLRFNVPGAARTKTTSIAVGDDVYVGGVKHYADGADNPQDAMYATVSKSPLSVEAAKGLWGGDDSEEVTDIAVASDGDVWTHGTSHFDTPGIRAWGVKIHPDTSACGWPHFGASEGVGRGMVTDGSSLYITGALEGDLYVAHYEASDCSPTGPCSCDPGWTARVLRSGSASAEGRALAMSTSSAYVVGFEDPGSGDLAATMVEVALDTGEALQWGSAWNPSSELDIYLDAKLEGSDLYVVGAYGVTSATEAMQGFVTKARTSDLVRQWTTTPAGITGMVGIDIDPSGGLVIVATDGTDTFVQRCLLDGTCP